MPLISSERAKVVDVAYSNNVPGASSTTLIGLDANLYSQKTLPDGGTVKSLTLVRQGGINVPPGTPSPNTGELTSLGAFGRERVTSAGLDVSPSGTTFVGVDAGWNVVNDHFIYGGPQAIVACARADEAPTGSVTVAGNINEGDDLFAEDEPMPPLGEGDVVAVLNCGSYAQSMTIVHCLRPPARAVFFHDRVVS